jgi:hypothetical protein
MPIEILTFQTDVSKEVLEMGNPSFADYLKGQAAAATSGRL